MEPRRPIRSPAPTRRPAKEQGRGVDGLTVAFTNLVGRHQLSIGIGLLAVGLALILGAFHAFAPGHGKTVMAAYLVADRGSLRQVSLIGLSVTATHTLGVLILGILLSTFATFAPEKVYPWLGVTSGLLLLSIGVSLLRGSMAAARRSGSCRSRDPTGSTITIIRIRIRIRTNTTRA